MYTHISGFTDYKSLSLSSPTKLPIAKPLFNFEYISFEFISVTFLFSFKNYENSV